MHDDTRIESGAPRNENRAMDRAYLELRAACGTEAFGETYDLAPDGLFIRTPSAHTTGERFRLVLTTPLGAISADVQVLRRTDDGLGVRIRDMAGDDRKRYRRLLAEANRATSLRNAARRLLNERAAVPMQRGEAVAQTLASLLRARANVVVDGHWCPWDANIVAGGAEGLILAGARAPAQAGEAVVVVDHRHRTYAFNTRYEPSGADKGRVLLPESLGLTEQRAEPREAVDDSSLVIDTPWSSHTFRVEDRSAGGLGIRALANNWSLPVDADVQGATLVTGDGARLPLMGARVTRVVRRSDGTLLVGIAYGRERMELAAQRMNTARLGFAGVWARVQDMLVGYWRRWFGRAAKPAPDRAVRFPNAEGLEVHALLDVVWSATEAEEAMPVVLVVPGFGGRKEQMSKFAMIVSETFARQGKPVAVLRMDGTNNLGHSAKDPGNAIDGRHTLNYRLSGVEADIKGALRFLAQHPRIRPTEVVIVSVSFSSCAVGHLLAHGTPELPVRLWLSYMGAPEARDAVLHVSGHHDAAAAIDERHRLLTLVGCLVDVHAFWRDAQSLGIGGATEAQADMAKVPADVLWLAGEHDGFMDLQRVRSLMTVKAPGKRRLVETDSGHVPTSGAEARQHFALMTREIWQHLHQSTLPDWTPSLHRLHAREEAEWTAARSARPADPVAYWRHYLLADGGIGFDVLRWYPSYDTFITSQADAVSPAGHDVLELGAGTGNLTVALHARGPKRLVAIDLVPEALARLREKVQGVETIAADIDGNAVTAMRLFAKGDIRDFGGLKGRVPVGDDVLTSLDDAADTRYPAYARGRLDPRDDQELKPAHRAALSTLHDISLAEGGLPFADESFDRVAMSIVLSYMQHPADLLAEVRRVLRPGGEFVLSSMLRDADTSGLFNACVQALRAAPDSAFAVGPSREQLLAGARHLLDAGSGLMRLEEEGHFRFWDADEFEELLTVAGFQVAERWKGFGDPGQAVCLRCRR